MRTNEGPSASKPAGYVQTSAGRLRSGDYVVVSGPGRVAWVKLVSQLVSDSDWFVYFAGVTASGEQKTLRYAVTHSVDAFLA